MHLKLTSDVIHRSIFQPYLIHQIKPVKPLLKNVGSMDFPLILNLQVFLHILPLGEVCHIENTMFFNSHPLQLCMPTELNNLYIDPSALEFSRIQFPTAYIMTFKITC